MHPDLAEALRRIGDALSASLGTEVRVRPQGDGCRVELRIASLEDAQALADRLRATAPSS